MKRIIEEVKYECEVCGFTSYDKKEVIADEIKCRNETMPIGEKNRRQSLTDILNVETLSELEIKIKEHLQIYFNKVIDVVLCMDNNRVFFKGSYTKELSEIFNSLLDKVGLPKYSPLCSSLPISVFNKLEEKVKFLSKHKQDLYKEKVLLNELKQDTYDIMFDKSQLSKNCEKWEKEIEKNDKMVSKLEKESLKIANKMNRLKGEHYTDFANNYVEPETSETYKKFQQYYKDLEINDNVLRTF